MLNEKWKPLNTGYEKYGMQSDIEYFKEKMVEESFFFPIETASRRCRRKPKGRADSLMPLFEEKKIHLQPKYMPYRQLDGKVIDIIQTFISEEYLEFPYCTHDDMIDCMARCTDEAIWDRLPEPDAPEDRSFETV